MSDQPFKDPAALWRDMVAQWEKGFNSVANQAMGSEEFSRAMHKATSASVVVQQAMGGVMERYLAALNLPSRAELTALGERLQGIEASLARIEARLDSTGTTLPAPGGIAVARPPRTRKPAPRQEAKPAAKSAAKP